MKYIIALVTLVFINAAAFSNEIDLNLYGETALIPAAGEYHIPLFSKSEYAFNESLSIRLHPIMFFLSPSVELKYNFLKKDNFYLSSKHSISSPAIILRLLQCKGTGGFISPEFELPFIFSLSNGLTASFILPSGHIISGSAAIEFALNNGNLEPGTSIDLPIILPRTMVYYKNTAFDIAFSAEGILSESFDYYLNNHTFLFPFEDKLYDYEYQNTGNSFFNELSAELFWKLSESFKIGFGGILCYGTYPFGSQWHLLPLLDFKMIIK